MNKNKLVIRAGNSIIEFEKWAGEENPYYHFAFNIPSNKIEEAFEWMKEKLAIIWLEDYKSYIADFINWNAKSIYFLDPAGNIVELIARRDLHDNPQTSFSASLIRNISEIGIVFPEDRFDSEVDQLLTSYGFTYFPKQKPLAHFRVIGDDEGLLICVPAKRDWYPLKEKPAKIFPMQVKILAGNLDALLSF